MVKTKILAMVLAVAMIVAIVPAFGLVAFAEDEQVLFDTAVALADKSGEIANIAEIAGWSETESKGAVAWNKNFDTTGTWSGSGEKVYGLMFFRDGSGRGSGDGNATATYAGGDDTALATKIQIDFDFGMQQADNLYQRWHFKDIDGKEIATFYFDIKEKATIGEGDAYTVAEKGQTGTLRGKHFTITATKAEEGYNVDYSVDSSSVYTETRSDINGFKSIHADIPSWNDNYTAAALLNLKITYEVPETVKKVTATYKADETDLGTVTKYYDSAVAAGAEFPEKYYAVDGSSDLYYTPATTLTEDGDIDLEVIDNADVAGIANGGQVYVDGKVYDVISDNVIPNGDFAAGLVGWFNGTKAAATEAQFTVNGDGTISAKGSTGQAGVNSVYRSWPIEAGATYVLTYTDTTGGQYHKISLANALPGEGLTDGENVIIDNGAAGTTYKVFTNDAYAYVRLSYRWLGADPKFGNYGLYKVEEADDQKLPDAVEAIDDITVIDGNDPFLPTTVKLTADDEPYGTGTVTEWTEGEDGKYTGTVDTGIVGYTLPAEAQVTVLDCTDNTLAAPIDNVNAQGGSLAAAHTLKYPVKSKASYEFDVVYHVSVGSDDLIALGDASISGGKPSFGSEAFAMQGSTKTAGNVGFRKTGGAWSDEFKTEKEKTYRVFTTIDPEEGTYDVTVRDESGVVFSDEGLTYRGTGTKVIDTLYIIYNKGDNKARTTVSNFRVAWEGSDQFKEIAIEYKAEDGTVINKIEGVYELGDQITYEAGKAYYDGKIYSYDAVDVTVAEDTDATITVDATVEQANAATEMAQERGGNLNLAGYKYGIAGTSNADVSAKDADGTALFNGAVSNFGTERRTNITFVKPDADDSQLIMLYLPVGVFKQNSTGIGDGVARLIAKVGDKETYSVNVLNDTSANNQTVYAEPVVLEFDVTDVLAAAEAGEAVTITIETAKGGAGFVDLDMAAFGGSKAGIAPYLAAVDAVKVTVEGAAPGALITKNGVKVEAPFNALAGDVIRIYKGATFEAGLAMAVVNDGTKADDNATVADGDTTIKIVEAPATAPEVSLGWTGSAFAFLVKPGEDATAVVAYTAGVEEQEIELDGSESIALTTEETNAIFTFAGKAEAAGKASAPVSIYSLVAEALSAWKSEDTIKAEQVDAVNEVISKGGLYIVGEALNPQAAMIFDYADGTISVKDKLFAAGIKLESISYQIGEDGEVKTATSADGKSVELAEGLSLETVIYLEDVEFVFETVDESVADETVSGELDFVEEV